MQKNFRIIFLCIASLAVAAPSAWADDNALIQQLQGQMRQMQQQIDVLSKRPAEPSGRQEKAGDQVTIKVQGVGELTNPVVGE